MATQYSNKPIVTNGLVYALDFGNQKSYVSGSLTTRNLIYSQISGTLYNGITSGSLTNGIFNFLNSTTPGLKIDVNDPFRAIDYGKTYTVATTLKVSSGNNNQTIFSRGPWYSSVPYVENRFALTYENGKLIHGINYTPTNDLGFGRGYNFNTDTLVHLTFRYSSGSWDYFVNGIPQTASLGSTYNNPSAGSLTTFSGRGALDENNFTGSLGNFLIYNRPLSSAEIWSNYQLSAQRYGLGSQTPKPYSLDENAYLFLQTAGITDPIITSSINTFVLGLKSASLWDKMIAIYPFVGTGSVGVNLTGSHKWNLKEPSLVTYPLLFTGSWNGSVSGSTPSGSGTAINTTVTPSTYYPNYSTSSAHISILSYDTPVSSSILAGTGMTKELAVSTLAGDYGTPAAAYSVRKVRTAYSGALMDVRRDYDNTTGSVGYVSNGDLDTGSLLDFVLPGRSTLPGAYSGLAAAYSLRRVSSSYSGSAIDVRRIWDNTTSSIGFDSNGNLNTGSLLNFTTSGSNILPYSNDFTQADWTKYDVQITASAVLGPYGLGSGSFINETSVSNFHIFNENINPVNTSSVHTISCFVKKQERRYVGLAFAYNGANHSYVTFDLDTTSSVSSGSAGTGYLVASSSINYVTDGWFRISLIGTVGLNDFFPRFYLTKDTTGYQPTYVGEPGTGSYVYGFQYTTGSTVQPYIPTNGTALFNVGNTSSFGYVAQWYDQSGNARHATQTATGSQPLIVSSGSLITENNKPALRFIIGNSSSLNLPNSPLSGSNAFGIYTVANFSSSNVYEMLYAEGLTTPNVEIRRDSTNNNLQWITGDGTFPAGTASINNKQILISINRNALVSNTAFVNGTLDATLTTSSNAITSTTASIGKRPDGYYFDGTVQEMSFFTGSAASSSRALIENNINTYYNVYTSSNAGYVARWYDQSGNNRHATQTTTGSQPSIVLSGSLIFENNKASIQFDGINDYLQKDFNTTIAQPYTNFLVTNRLSNSPQIYIDGFDPNRGAMYYSSGNAAYLGSGLGSSNTTSKMLYTLLANNANTQIIINSNVEITGNAGTAAFQPITIGTFIGGATMANMNMQEFILYASNQSPYRGPIEYGINNYYNIYTQPSASFATSSFAIYATTSSISASINNDLQSGIASSGPLGFITVSRTGSNALTLARNGVTSSFAVPASGALSTNLYLGAINNNGLALGSSPYNISFASVGTGLTNAEVNTYSRLLWGLQYNLGRSTIVTQSLLLNLDAGNRTSYPGSGSTWFDISGNNKNGVLYNGPTFNSADGGSIVLDGVNDYVSGSGTLLTTQGTLIVWFKTSNTYSNNYLFTIPLAGGANGFDLGFGGSSTFRGIVVTTNGSKFLNYTTTYSDNNWHMGAITYSASNAVLYYDGVARTTDTTLSGSLQQNASGQYYIGSFDGTGYYVAASISNAVIYNRALTAAEITQNYNATRGKFGI